MIGLDRAIDFLTEPRAPTHIVQWYARRMRFPASAPHTNEPPDLCLTFDVEQDLGSLGTPEYSETCRPFLEWLAERTAADGWRTTLFVQGSIVSTFAARLRELAPAHDIGLHGYYHELWGRPLWFTRQPGTPVPVRHERLGQGICAFDDAGLARPCLWRSPNLVSDDATDRMIADAGFTLDSSAPSFRGALPLIRRHGSVVEIPVSANPRPRIRRRYGVPTWARYDLLNTPNLLGFSDSELRATIDTILACQDAAGCRRHLVVLAHPWEFADIRHPGCGRENLDRLIERVEFVRAEFNAHLCALRDLVLPASVSGR
ncbi:MAG: hypothetical protein EPO26_01645 [Chloroflexota bacterium]|nr:MAG: hypothetical protein EPO26_01645 [Chloroflexota bacterium]